MAKKRRKPPSPPAARRPRIPRGDVAALAIAACVFLVCCFYLAPFTPDDTFISYRYAEHLASGHGLTFNIGRPPVEAYSNFLWILVCALMRVLGLDLPAAAPVASIMLGLGALATLWTLTRRRTQVWTQQVPPLVAFAAAAPFVLYAVSGMETALFAFLLLLLVRFTDDVVITRRPAAVAGLAATGFLVSLTRPEGLVAFPAVAAMLAWHLRRGGARGARAETTGSSADGPSEDTGSRARQHLLYAAGAFVLLTIAYHAWRVSYFGNWLPTPFLSKGAEGGTLVSGWYKNFQHYFVNWAYYSPPFGYYFLALGALAFGGMRMARDDDAGVATDRIAFVLAGLLALVYVNFVDWMPAMRYDAPLVGLFLVPVARLHRLVPEETWRAAVGTRRAEAVSLAVALLVVLWLPLSHVQNVVGKMTESHRKCLMPLATWLRDTVPPGSLLAMGDVGTVPYYSGLQTLDIHPQSLTDVYIAEHQFSVNYVMAQHPDVIALSVRGVYSARMDPLHFELYKNEGFRNEYRFIGTVRHQWYEDRAYWVFMRGSLEIETGRLSSFPSGIGKQSKRGFQ